MQMFLALFVFLMSSEPRLTPIVSLPCHENTFVKILEPSFLISRFPQKKTKQFKVEFIEANVVDQSSAFTTLLGVFALRCKGF